MEKKAIEIKRYAEFVMLLVYTVVFVLTVSFLLHYVFGMELKPFLPFELLFALIYVEAKRDPEKMVMVWFITVKSKTKTYFNYLYFTSHRCNGSLGSSAFLNDDWWRHRLRSSRNSSRSFIFLLKGLGSFESRLRYSKNSPIFD